MTVRQRLTDIALAISGGSPSGASGGGWSEGDIARYLAAVERLAACACDASPSPSGASCFPFKSGGVEVVPPYFLGGVSEWHTPDYPSVVSSIPAGSYRIVASPQADGGESVGVLISVTQSNGQNALHTMTAVNYGQTAQYDFDIATGASVVITSLGGGYPSNIRSLSLCPRAAGINTAVVLSAGTPLRDTYGILSPPPVGVPWPSPLGWYSLYDTAVSGVAQLSAVGLGRIAQAWVDANLTPENVYLTLRAYNPSLQNIATQASTHALNSIGIGDAIAYVLTSPVEAGTRFLLSVAMDTPALEQQFAQIAAQVGAAITLIVDGEPSP